MDKRNKCKTMLIKFTIKLDFALLMFTDKSVQIGLKGQLANDTNINRKLPICSFV